MFKTKPELQGRAFELLLDWLNPDRAVAASEYVRLHAGLTKMFESRGCLAPHDRADETFDRVARQLSDGKDLPGGKQAAYLYGVARYIVREQWIKPKHEEVSPDQFLVNDQSATNDTSEQERKHDCLDHCLEKLPEDSRMLVLKYYAEDKSSKIDTREQMAQDLGIATVVLRNRIYKLRKRLRECVNKCLER